MVGIYKIKYIAISLSFVFLVFASCCTLKKLITFRHKDEVKLGMIYPNVSVKDVAKYRAIQNAVYNESYDNLIRKINDSILVDCLAWTNIPHIFESGDSFLYDLYRASFFLKKNTLNGILSYSDFLNKINLVETMPVEPSLYSTLITSKEVTFYLKKNIVNQSLKIFNCNNTNNTVIEIDLTSFTNNEKICFKMVRKNKRQVKLIAHDSSSDKTLLSFSLKRINVKKETYVVLKEIKDYSSNHSIVKPNVILTNKNAQDIFDKYLNMSIMQE